MLLRQGPIRTWDEFLCYWLSREIRQLEQRHGLELADMSELRELTIACETKEHGYPYGPSPPRVMRVLLENFGPDFSQTTFIDLGSGKGLPMLMASHFNFAKIVGVEFANELHEAAVKNIERYSSESQICKELEPIHGDVLNYEFPESDLFVYLCNPFNEQILKQIINRLIELRARTGRKISVVYQQMRREDGDYRAARIVKQTIEESGQLSPHPVHIRRLLDRVTLSHLTFMAYDLR